MFPTENIIENEPINELVSTEKCAFVNDTRKEGSKIIDLSAIERNSKYSLFEAD